MHRDKPPIGIRNVRKSIVANSGARKRYIMVRSSAVNRKIQSPATLMITCGNRNPDFLCTPKKFNKEKKDEEKEELKDLDCINT